VENGLCSTFFVIPFKDRPGKSSDGGLAPRFRAAGYGAKEIEGAIKKIMAAGCEVGLHGIDAWHDTTSAHDELEEIRRVTGGSRIGVRMHWLYYDQQSPVVLEQAEAAYDTTIGYRETVGYHAGTMQAFKPLQAVRLLELPMQIMDTALFYPSYLGLTARQATPLLRRMVDKVVEFGGCITINWHDRSLAPERNWEASYRELVEDLKNRGAWFATVSQAVSWFEMRRSVVFDPDYATVNGIRAKVKNYECDSIPGLRLRVHKAEELRGGDRQGSLSYADNAFNGSVDCQNTYGVGA
jgi:hypothetical protein